MDRKPEIAVLLPCYNEAATIGKVVRDFRAALPDAVIYVYDNNSTDGTGSIAAEAGAVVRMEHTQGKGAVVRSMFRDIEADIYLMADGDDTYPAEAAWDLIRAVTDRGADMAVGDRLSTTYFTENKRMFHSFGNKLVRKSVEILFGSRTRDVMTGYRAFNYRFVKTFPVLSSGFEIETEMTVHAADRKMRVVDVPVAFRDRPEGSESKLDTVSDGIRVMLAIARLFRTSRPMAFFGGLGLACVLAACALMCPVMAEYFATGLVRRFPTLIACCAMGGTGIQLIACGLVLSALRSRDEHEFEFRLQQATWNRRRHHETET